MIYRSCQLVMARTRHADYDIHIADQRRRRTPGAINDAPKSQGYGDVRPILAAGPIVE